MRAERCEASEISGQFIIDSSLKAHCCEASHRSLSTIINKLTDIWLVSVLKTKASSGSLGTYHPSSGGGLPCTIKIINSPIPTAAVDEVLIKVIYSSVNAKCRQRITTNTHFPSGVSSLLCSELEPNHLQTRILRLETGDYLYATRGHIDTVGNFFLLH